VHEPNLNKITEFTEILASANLEVASRSNPEINKIKNNCSVLAFIANLIVESSSTEVLEVQRSLSLYSKLPWQVTRDCIVDRQILGERLYKKIQIGTFVKKDIDQIIDAVRKKALPEGAYLKDSWIEYSKKYVELVTNEKFKGRNETTQEEYRDIIHKAVLLGLEALRDRDPILNSKTMISNMIPSSNEDSFDNYKPEELSAISDKII